MNNQKTRPSGWYYGLAALALVLGCLIAMVVAYRWFPGLPGTFESKMNLDDLTQVVVPGSKDITFAESGAYAVYHEYRSVVDGAVYASSETPPALVCSLTSKTTGADIGVVPDYVKTNTYSSKDRERVGVLIRSITIDEPGAYTSPAATRTAGHNRRSCWPSDGTLSGSSSASRQEPSSRLWLAWPCFLARVLSRLSL